MNDDEAVRLGNTLIAVLGLKVDRRGRVNTMRGEKTATGLGYMVAGELTPRSGAESTEIPRQAIQIKQLTDAWTQPAGYRYYLDRQGRLRYVSDNNREGFVSPEAWRWVHNPERSTS